MTESSDQPTTSMFAPVTSYVTSSSASTHASTHAADSTNHAADSSTKQAARSSGAGRVIAGMLTAFVCTSSILRTLVTHTLV
mmetsp:Transcript_51686/g.116479  ORF Transcript_51686/g.116479 Transcript_51686/m.116479 type:complete len:82 (-) Transcript_51686:70-315(-)